MSSVEKRKLKIPLDLKQARLSEVVGVYDEPSSNE